MHQRARIVDGLLCLWPGLRDLWRHGRLGGLMTALLFAAILQTVLLTCVIWPDLISVPSRAVVCFSGLVFWLAFAAPDLAQSADFRKLSVETVDREHLFQSAQSEYLKGNWFQAETLLGRLIQIDSEDVEARLYLATMNRHIDRLEAALDGLDQLEDVTAARRWQWEVKQERRVIARRQRELVAEANERATAVDAA